MQLSKIYELVENQELYCLANVSHLMDMLVLPIKFCRQSLSVVIYVPVIDLCSSELCVCSTVHGMFCFKIRKINKISVMNWNNSVTSHNTDSDTDSERMRDI